MKQRFSAYDVRAIVPELKKKVVGLRIQNIYEISGRIFLLKFAKPDVKEFIVVESGTRIHTTQFAREKQDSPSSFCLKLRKHVRAKRLMDIQQMGYDRIIDMTIGGSDNPYHLIFEFYAAGNVILTDKDYTILSLLRVVNPNESALFAVGLKYPMMDIKPPVSVEKSFLSDVLSKAQPHEQLKKVFGSLGLGNILLEHVLLSSGFSSNSTVGSNQLQDENSEVFDTLFRNIKEAETLYSEIGNSCAKGYIIYKENENHEKLYEDFHPLLFKQHEKKSTIDFETFDECVDEYYSRIEQHKIIMKDKTQEATAMKKLNAIKKEQENRLSALEQAQAISVHKANLIQMNLEKVDEAIVIVRSAIASGVDWVELEEMINLEKRRRNPVALLIHKLDLDSNQLTLGLRDDYSSESSESESDSEDSSSSETENSKVKETILIDVDIYLSAFANAQQYYDSKKTSQMKHTKTEAHSGKALRSAEKKIWQDMKAIKTVSLMSKIRKPYWFEKFSWFISSENYLVIAGRDMQQNELLVKKYLRKGDVYVHADLHGAASVVVRNNDSNSPISPSTLSQAGCMSVCLSKAWDAKIVTSAWWVHAEQVSKTAPSGEYLTTGSFMIRGKKNFLPPTQLVYGFGILFRVDDACVSKHLDERRTNEQWVSGQDQDEPDSASSIPMDHLTERYNLHDINEKSGGVIDEILGISSNHNSSKISKTTQKQKAVEKKKIPKKPETPPQQQQQKKQQGSAVPRGKKSKLRKIKKKYGDQDDEERKIKMALLASSGRKSDENDDEPLEEEPESESVKEKIEIQSGNMELQKGEKSEASGKDINEQDVPEDQVSEDENMADDQEDKVTFLEHLTGNPYEDDTLLYAVPVCAPYSSILKYKYKVKLLPGSLKKGKACKLCISHFTGSDEASDIETKLMKSIPDMEMILQMLGKVRVSAPNLEQTKKKKKK